MENAFLFVTGISDGSCLAVRGQRRVRRRPRRLRDGGPGREGRHRPHPRAPGRAPERAPAMSDVRATTATTTAPVLRVRPYALTGGRTRSNADLPDRDARARRRPQGVSAAPRLAARAQEDRRRCATRRCRSPRSPPTCSIPLGVARVLVGDMADEGFLHELQATTRPDRRPSRPQTARKGARWPSGALTLLRQPTRSLKTTTLLCPSRSSSPAASPSARRPSSARSPRSRRSPPRPP